jgi:acetyl-CoA acetyltransferase
MRAHDLPPFSDGACAVIIATADKARELSDNPVWIRGIDHRIEIHQPGMRDLRESPSTAAAGKAAGVGDGPVDLAELSVAYSHQEKILTDALGLGDGVKVNPSGGPLTANPMMATGLSRIAEAARAIQRGDGKRAVAHATSGQPLQQNLVCVLEGDK